MKSLIYLNKAILEFDAEKFYRITHDHVLTEFTESDNTEWLKVIKGLGGGLSSAWRHTFVFNILQLKISLLLTGNADHLGAKNMADIMEVVEAVNLMIKAAQGADLIVLGQKQKAIIKLAQCESFTWLKGIPHFRDEVFETEWKCRELKKRANVLELKFRGCLKRQFQHGSS